MLSFKRIYGLEAIQDQWMIPLSWTSQAIQGRHRTYVDLKKEVLSDAWPKVLN